DYGLSNARELRPRQRLGGALWAHDSACEERGSGAFGAGLLRAEQSLVGCSLSLGDSRRRALLAARGISPGPTLRPECARGSRDYDHDSRRAFRSLPGDSRGPRRPRAALTRMARPAGISSSLLVDDRDAMNGRIYFGSPGY